MVVFLVVVIWVASMTLKITTGVSETLDSPDYVVRLQVLNGCEVNGLAARASDWLADYADSDIEVKVVDTDNFDLHKVTGTFIISRDEDMKVARMLAGKLGLEPSTVVYRPLEKNYRQISATLVLGEDWESLNLAQRLGRE